MKHKKKTVIKTWSRADDRTGIRRSTFAVLATGNKFIPVYVTETWWVTNW